MIDQEQTLRLVEELLQIARELLAALEVQNKTLAKIADNTKRPPTHFS